jgi:hypothetical protein
MNKTKVMARPLFKDLKIFNEPIAKKDLTELLEVNCIHENILMYGRYVKLSR